MLIVSLPLLPLFPFALTVFGFWDTYVITVISINIGGASAYYYAKKLGAPSVKVMLGVDNYKKMKKVLSKDKSAGILLLRVFANNYFDIVSFVSGLSNISFPRYLAYSLIGSSFWSFVNLLLIKYASSYGKEATLGMIGIIYVVISIPAVIVIRTQYKK